MAITDNINHEVICMRIAKKCSIWHSDNINREVISIDHIHMAFYCVMKSIKPRMRRIDIRRALCSPRMYSRSNFLQHWRARHRSLHALDAYDPVLCLIDNDKQTPRSLGSTSTEGLISDRIFCYFLLRCSKS
jgi:hypothetical protein